MLRSTNEIQGYSILTKDGRFGSASGFLYEIGTWMIRYLVMKLPADDAGDSDQRTRIIPVRALFKPDWIGQIVLVMLTAGAIKKSPPIDESGGIARKLEKEVYAHYRWEPYWTVEAVEYPASLAGNGGYELEAGEPPGTPTPPEGDVDSRLNGRF